MIGELEGVVWGGGEMAVFGRDEGVLWSCEGGCEGIVIEAA